MTFRKFCFILLLVLPIATRAEVLSYDKMTEVLRTIDPLPAPVQYYLSSIGLGLDANVCQIPFVGLNGEYYLASKNKEKGKISIIRQKGDRFCSLSFKQLFADIVDCPVSEQEVTERMGCMQLLLALSNCNISVSGFAPCKDDEQEECLMTLVRLIDQQDKWSDALKLKLISAMIASSSETERESAEEILVSFSGSEETIPTSYSRSSKSILPRFEVLNNNLESVIDEIDKRIWPDSLHLNTYLLEGNIEANDTICYAGKVCTSELDKEMVNLIRGYCIIRGNVVLLAGKLSAFPVRMELNGAISKMEPNTHCRYNDIEWPTFRIRHGVWQLMK